MASINEKINYINETKSLIKDKLNDLGSEIDNETTFRKYAEKIEDLYNEWPKISNEDTIIILNNTKKGKMNLQLKGNTLQNGTPTPSSPINVETVTGNQEIIVCSKNSFDKTTATLRKGVSTSNGNLYNDNALFSTDYIEITPNISYVVNGYSTSAKRVYGACYDASKNYLTNVTTNANILTFIVTNTSAKYIRLTGLLSDIDTYQLEKGSTATSYTPYVSQSYPISLGETKLCKIGDYQDYIYKDNKKWYKYNAIGKVIVDGSEGWLKSNMYQGSFYLSNNNPKYNGLVIPYSDLYCNYFTRANISSSSQISSNYTQGTCFIEKSNGVLDFWYDNGTSSISDWTNWLETHNIITYFPLATPTATEITDTTLINQLNNLEKAISYENQTNISQENDNLPFIINATALIKNSD